MLHSCSGNGSCKRARAEAPLTSLCMSLHLVTTVLDRGCYYREGLGLSTGSFNVSPAKVGIHLIGTICINIISWLFNVSTYETRRVLFVQIWIQAVKYLGRYDYNIGTKERREGECIMMITLEHGLKRNGGGQARRKECIGSRWLSGLGDVFWREKMKEKI